MDVFSITSHQRSKELRELSALNAEPIKIQILDWLSDACSNSKQAKLTDMRMPQTGQWLSLLERWEEFLSGDENVLWCYGKPGSGKSMLMSLAVGELEKEIGRSLEDAVVYYYFDHGSRAATQTVISSILRQLCKLDVPMPNLLKTKWGQRSQEYLHLEEVIFSFFTLASKFERVFVCLDGLDACNDFQEMTVVLQRLIASPWCRLFITSRMTPKLYRVLKGAYRVRIEDYNQPDLRLYPNYFLLRNPQYNKVMSEFSSSQASKMFSCSDGNHNFLGLILRLDELSKQINAYEVKRLSGELEHSSLIETYKIVLRRINYQAPARACLANHILTWVAYAYRPLTFRELQQAVTIDGGDPQSATNLELVSPARLMEEVSMGLLAVDYHQNMVTTIPPSLASYLQYFRKILFPGGEKYIATCIVSFLQHKRLAKPLEIQTDYDELLKDLPFSAYASQHWGTHVREYWREDIPRLVSNILGFQLDALAQFLHIFHPHFANRSDRLSYPRGFSAAHFAVYFNFQNSEDVVGRETLDTWKRNILHIACLQGHADQVENFGFDEEHNLRPVVSTDIFDDDAEEIAAPSTTSHSSKTRLDVLCFFLEQMKDIDIDQRDKDGKTPLHYATISGNKPMVQSLLKHGADTAVLDESSWMPLDYAARENDLGIARSLLSQSSQYMKTSNETGKPPGDSKALWIAASRGHRDMVRLFLRYEISGQDRALLEAAKAGFFDIVRLLHRRRGYAKLSFQDDHSMTALHYAILTRNLEIADYLMRDSDVNAVDKKGRSPLHLAAEIGDLDIVRQLIRRGAKIKVNDKSGQTPLDVAVENGNSNVVKSLLNYRDPGAILSGSRRSSTIGSRLDVNERLGNADAEEAPDARQAVPAQEEAVAVEELNQPNAPEPKEPPPSTQLTALQRACSTGNKAVVAALLDAGMGPDDTGTTFRTPLSYAAENGHEEVVKQLLKTHRVDVNAADDHGRTPLSYAAAHVQIFDLLFKEDASQRLPSFLRTQTRQLRRRLKSAIIVNHEGDSLMHKWISLASIKSLIRDAEVVTTLHETSAEKASWTADYIETLKDFVLKKALRLFALLVSEKQVQLLDLFCSNGFGDEMFPIKLVESDEENETDGQNKPRWTIQSIAKQMEVSYRGQEVETRDIEAICLLWQWQFFVPVFSQNDPVYVFDPQCHMPFLQELGTTQTNFSVVRHFVIHRSHLDFPDLNQIGDMTDNEGNPHVAIKELTAAQGLTPENYQQVARNESVVLNRFRNESHPHLIRAIAYYTQGNRHFFMFPWARGGNLRDFWQSQPSLSPTSFNFSAQDSATYLKWFFTQLLGLAGAIKSLHYPHDMPGESCRHGDLKPENILCFGKQETGPANIPINVKLVVADAGQAKVHDKATEFRVEQTTTQGRTRMYSPPEAEFRPQEATTRRYDIWSMGCLYLEFLIWILYGNDALERFHHDIGHGQPFFEIVQPFYEKLQPFHEKVPSVAVNGVVKQWIDAIRDGSQCSSPAGLTALGHLAVLIEDRLLVVNVNPPPRDSVSQDNGIRSKTTSDHSPDADMPILMVVQATIRPDTDQSLDPERADAIEMFQEIEKIYLAASEGDLAWINWDGIKEAARLGLPQILYKNSELSRTGSVGER